MTGITKQEAATLWGNGFKLQDKEGNVWRIIEVFENNRMGIYNESKPMDGYACKRHISYSEVGSDYFIISRPLSQLTQEIEHEGKMITPIVELAKISYPSPKEPWKILATSAHSTSGEFWYSHMHKGFRCMAFQEDTFVPNQPALFAYMDSLHFDRFSWKERGLTVDKSK